MLAGGLGRPALLLPVAFGDQDLDPVALSPHTPLPLGHDFDLWASHCYDHVWDLDCHCRIYGLRSPFGILGQDRPGRLPRLSMVGIGHNLAHCDRFPNLCGTDANYLDAPPSTSPKGITLFPLYPWLSVSCLSLHPSHPSHPSHPVCLGHPSN